MATDPASYIGRMYARTVWLGRVHAGHLCIYSFTSKRGVKKIVWARARQVAASVMSRCSDVVQIESERLVMRGLLYIFSQSHAM